jgi:drug/metabolite transporter (DMT)-like permease
MTLNKSAGLTVLAMVAFASNSLLCRMALKHTAIDPASFTVIRIVSGAIVLWLLVRLQGGARATGGHWLSACALFAYAIAFSWAYISLSAATGALLLFGAVQATMIGYGRWRGERLSPRQLIGFLAALLGLCSLLLPGLTAPPLVGAVLMLSAGVAWGIYSLRGKSSGAPLETTAGNFMRAVPFAVLASAISMPWMSIDLEGVAYAIASGALASGIGYAIWYAALPSLTASAAATVQLSVPVIAAFGGVILLDEAVTPRLLLASLAILGGIALVVLDRAKLK